MFHTSGVVSNRNSNKLAASFGAVIFFLNKKQRKETGK
jgi:hypothetical protein